MSESPEQQTQVFQVLPVCGRVDYNFIKVYDKVRVAMGDCLHGSLEAGGGPSQTLGSGNPLELALPQEGEGSVGSHLGVQ